MRKKHIQRAYKGIMAFMSDLKAYLERQYPEYSASALYFGYMDMTYFAFTPSSLKNRNLKVAIVYLHEECRFECWLVGKNRKVQAEYIKLFSHQDSGGYSLSEIQPGVDSIIAASIVEQPDFDNPDKLKKLIEAKLMVFAEDMNSLLKTGECMQLKEMKKELIAPCGMNCRLCYAYQREKNKCDGCRQEASLPNSRRKCIIKNCPVIHNNASGFCYECDKHPCRRLKDLDRRYRTKYHMSMLENLEVIKNDGIDVFLRQEEKRWTCSNCGHIVCVHRDVCPSCHQPNS